MFKKGHPKGLYLCFSVEMWERMSFYGMKAFFALFLTGALGLTEEIAGLPLAVYGGLVYLTPLIGGYVADRYWGMNKAIIFGGIVMAIGEFMLGIATLVDPAIVRGNMLWFMYVPLVVMTFGCGFIKANISTTVGTMYEKNDPRRDSAYTIFYMGINVGAFLGPIICGTFSAMGYWSLAFFSVGFLMLVGIVNYIIFNRKLLPAVVFHPASKNSDGTKANHPPLTRVEKQRIVAIFVLMFFMMLFWVGYEQAGGSFNWFTQSATDRVVHFLNYTFTIPTEWFQSVNPVFIFILSPLIASIWVKLAERQLEPGTVSKFAWAMGFLGLGFAVMVLAAWLFQKTGRPVSMFWIILVYFIHTIGELCSSPIGLSLVTKLSPLKFMSMLMGVWFLGAAGGNFFAGFYSGKFGVLDHVTFFAYPAIATGVAVVLILLLAKPVKRWMHGVH